LGFLEEVISIKNENLIDNNNLKYKIYSLEKLVSVFLKDLLDLFPSEVSNTQAPPVSSDSHFLQYHIPFDFLFTAFVLHMGHLNFDLDLSSIDLTFFLGVDPYLVP
jgi:hypothetical protein